MTRPRPRREGADHRRLGSGRRGQDADGRRLPRDRRHRRVRDGRRARRSGRHGRRTQRGARRRSGSRSRNRSGRGRDVDLRQRAAERLRGATQHRHATGSGTGHAGHGARRARGRRRAGEGRLHIGRVEQQGVPRRFDVAEPEPVEEGRGGGGTVVGVQLEAVEHGVAHQAGDAGVELDRRWQAGAGLPVEGAHGRPAGEQAVERGGHAVHVARGTEVAGAGVLLRRGVARGDGPGHRLPRLAVEAPGQPEVDQHHPPLLGEHHVGGVHVAVQQARLVDRLERRGDPRGHVEHLVGGERAAAGPLQVAQRAAAEELHDQVGGVVRLENLVDVDDPRLREPGEDPRFAQEPLTGLAEGLPVARRGEHHRPVAHGRRGEQLLDGHSALQALVLDLVGDAEATPPDDAPHLVPAVEDGPLGQLCRRGQGAAAPGADQPAPVYRRSTARATVGGVDRSLGLAHVA